MLTVKVHSFPQDGLGIRDETIYSAVNVTCAAVRNYEDDAKPQLEGFMLHINLCNGKDQNVNLSDNIAVFVENSAGKTVQVYRPTESKPTE